MAGGIWHISDACKIFYERRGSEYVLNIKTDPDHDFTIKDVQDLIFCLEMWLEHMESQGEENEGN